MITTTESKIPTAMLPEDWRDQGAKKFKCSISKIERIVYGTSPITSKNKEIFAYMLELAETEKKRRQELSERLSALQPE
jgi:hypothetical protein